MSDLIINIDGKKYNISPMSNINLSNVKEDNIFFEGFKNKYDTSQDNIINNGEEINIFMDDLSKIVKEDNTLDNELLDKYFAELPAEKNGYTKKGFLDFLKSILPQSNKTNKWIVQNNQALEKISKMILNQSGKKYTYKDVLEMNETLKKLNKTKLDGSKNGFRVGSEIILPQEIDISGEKVSADPVYDYVYWSQTDKINNIIKDYNLIDKNIKSELFNDTKSLVEEFSKRYGRLKSSSRETLLLEPYYSSSEKVNESIGYIRTHNCDNSKKLALDKTDSLVRQHKAANCAECADLIDRLIYNKFKDKYTFSAITFDDVKYNPSKGHIATLIKSKSSDEEYVIDMWINPRKGGIYKKSDWIKMMQKVYQLDKYEVDYNASTQSRLDEEYTFLNSAKKLQNMLPEKYLESSDNFARCIYNDLTMGKTFQKNVMDLWDEYNYGYKDRFNNNKDFYELRNTLLKEVSAEGLREPQYFGNEVYEGCVRKNKTYSTTTMSAFKKFCPSKYKEYLQVVELKKMATTLRKYFPNEKNLEYEPAYALDLICKGIKNKKSYPQEIMQFFEKNAPDWMKKFAREN